MLTPAMTASRVSPPDLMMSIALAHARTPLPLEMTMFFGLPCALTTRIMGTAAAPRMAARRLNVRGLMGASPFARSKRGQDDDEDLTLCHRGSGREKSGFGGRWGGCEMKLALRS